MCPHEHPGGAMSVAEEGLQRLRMSWEEYLALPERPRAEWVDGEVVVAPPVGPPHGVSVLSLGAALRSGLAPLLVMTEVGVELPRNRLRAPDLTVVADWPEGRWVSETPVLVVEVLSPSTRREDLVRKSHEYAQAGISQYWIVDPEAGALDVYALVEAGWEPLLHLDTAVPTGEVVVGVHGTVGLDLHEILPRGPIEQG